MAVIEAAERSSWSALTLYLCVFCSMFVLLKGATKEQAFKIGHEIAEAVTATNPKPVKLKFEKVLHTHRHTQTFRHIKRYLLLCVCFF